MATEDHELDETEAPDSEFDELLHDAVKVPDVEVPPGRSLADALSAGTMVTDNVKLLRPLGRGGMGAVWAAEHLSLRTEVAVKFSAVRLADRPALRRRFDREARSAARLKSPHVIRTFDYGVMSGGTPFIVMELLEGESLAERLDRAEPCTVAEMRIILAQMCAALSEAHELGIVHRDIKPANIFLTRIRRGVFAKLLDFGVAKSEETRHHLTSGESLVGTPLYMSPEQIKSPRGADERADLWALGVVAYEALTGRVPFDGETIGALAIAIDEGAYTPMSELRPDLPPELDRWLEKALAHDPDERFESAEEMLDAFDRAVDAPVDPTSNSDPVDPTSDGDPALEEPTLLRDAPESAEPLEPTRMQTPMVMPLVDGAQPARPARLQNTLPSAGVDDGEEPPPPPEKRGAAVLGWLGACAAVAAMSWVVASDWSSREVRTHGRGTSTTRTASPSPVLVEHDASATTPRTSATTGPSADAGAAAPPTSSSTSEPRHEAAKPSPRPRVPTPTSPGPTTQPPPIQPAPQPAPADGRPAYCDDENLAFRRNAQNRLELKPECR